MAVLVEQVLTEIAVKVGKAEAEAVQSSALTTIRRPVASCS